MKKIILSKSAQTTIFMIVAVVVILGGIFFFYSSARLPKPTEPEITIVQEQVPIEFDPIRKYASDCVHTVSVEGLRIMGSQGGYISLTNVSLNKEHFTINSVPTESDAVMFTQDSELKIPYWWYLKSQNKCSGNCIFASKRPDLRATENSMEKQLERYVTSQFKECLDGFQTFKQQGFTITEHGEVKSDVTIGRDDVVILVEYPIVAQKQDVKASMKQFIATVPLDLENIYDLATKITNMESKHKYLEKHIANLIVAFSGTDREKLPPMSDMQFKFGSSVSWAKSDVKDKVTKILATYIPLFQVDGTYNYNRNIFSSELKQRVYDSAIIPVTNSTFRNLEASFSYLDFWPAYFDLNCDGERCVAKSANSLFSFFGIQDYRFSYDVSFPVLVEIRDPGALDSKGYTFTFFLEGNIRNNKAMPGNFTQLEQAQISESSLLCDTRTSGNVTVDVRDAATSKPVEDAQVLYTVADESCFVGATRSGLLSDKFPVGVGGFVNVIKDGYIGKAVEFDAQAGKNDRLSVELQPIYDKKLIVKKKNVEKTIGWQFVDSAVDLSSKEIATVSLERITDGSELEFSTAATYEGSPADIQIAPGRYSIDANLILNERIVVPEREKCVSAGFFGGEECYKIPKVDFGEKSSPGNERFPEGGLKLDFTIKPQDLENHDTIVIYVVSPNIAGIPEKARVMEDLDQLGKIEEYSQTYQLALRPAFK